MSSSTSYPSNVHSASGYEPEAASAAASATETASELIDYKSFDEMGLPDQLLRGVYAFGFDKPSQIQERAIVPMTQGRDLLAQAQSGTGKTGTFSIGGLSRVDPTRNEVQMVVISPTRELADQTRGVIAGIGIHMGIRVHTATGGPPVHEDIAVLKQGSGRPPHVPHALVVTPGRFYDLLNRKVVSPETIRVLVLDEADQMLEARFREQIHCILGLHWPEHCQVALLSATMIPELAAVAKSLLRNPVEILREADTVTLEGIKQWYVEIDREDQKLDTLCDIYDNLSITQATIFVNTRARAEWLAEQMRKRGFDLDCIHGEMDVEERKRRMAAFRSGQCRVLISTDLLARGIDVQQVSLVLNYELPVQRENYVHRIGRSGRYGKKGASINLVTERELRYQSEIESFYSCKVSALPIDLNIM
jgi:translation initiation factor 4A